jgi:hypothetical protein
MLILILLEYSAVIKKYASQEAYNPLCSSLNKNAAGALHNSLYQKGRHD